MYLRALFYTTPTQKNPNIFGFSLTYSYLCGEIEN